MLGATALGSVHRSVTGPNVATAGKLTQPVLDIFVPQCLVFFAKHGLTTRRSEGGVFFTVVELAETTGQVNMRWKFVNGTKLFESAFGAEGGSRGTAVKLAQTTFKILVVLVFVGNTKFGLSTEGSEVGLHRAACKLTLLGNNVYVFWIFVLDATHGPFSNHAECSTDRTTGKVTVPDCALFLESWLRLDLGRGLGLIVGGLWLPSFLEQGGGIGHDLF